MSEERLLNGQSSTSSGLGDDAEALAIEKPFALAFYRTTPRCAYLISGIASVISHTLFVIGQVSVMWYLFVGVNFTGELRAIDAETRLIFKALKIENPITLNVTLDYHVEDFTYGMAVQRLWQAVGLDSTVGPRIVAMTLVLFSGVWPHLKLVILNYYWYFPAHQATRTSAFYWLSTFGKWSLCDVFLVCVLIGVVHLDINLDADVILHRLRSEVPHIVSALEQAVSEREAVDEVCNTLLHLKHKDIQFMFCSETIYELYQHPWLIDRAAESVLTGVEANGGGVATLRIAGLWGIYLFCLGVIISLSLGLVIDGYDHQAKASLRYHRRLSEADAFGSRYFVLHKKVEANVFSKRSYCFLILTGMFALGMGILGVFLPSMERRVPGAVPKIINETLDVDFTKQYSLYDLILTTGAKGGADYLLMGIFALFCLVGPLLRAGIAVVELCIPATKRGHTRQLFLVNLLGVFSSWDVLFLAIYLVNLEMPPITNTIIDPHGEACRILKQFGSSDTCLEIEYGVVWPGIMFWVLAFITHIGTCIYIVKLAFHALDPYHDGDKGGPYCPQFCGSLLSTP